MIRAGEVSEISPSSGDWLILDIGFANKSKSCGLLINKERPIEIRFDEAKREVCDLIAKCQRPMNLIIEAPLSVAFDRHGNPTGRAIEKQGSKTRYWYVGPGCAVMVAALYLIKDISEVVGNTEVRLFEGFVSFKKKNDKSNNLRDVMFLKEVAENCSAYPDAIIEAEALRLAGSDTLQSAFLVAGIDTGVPPVIMRNG